MKTKIIVIDPSNTLSQLGPSVLTAICDMPALIIRSLKEGGFKAGASPEFLCQNHDVFRLLQQQFSQMDSALAEITPHVDDNTLLVMDFSCKKRSICTLRLVFDACANITVLSTKVVLL